MVETMSMGRVSAAIAASALSLSALTACGETDDGTTGTDAGAEFPASSASPAAEEVETEGAEQPNDEAVGDDAGGGDDAAGRDLPAEVSGYTAEAESEMADEELTEADVERILAAANDNEPGVEIEWEDDGHWEISSGEIEIDIDPQGLVLDVDKDD
nr:Uncharacterised protein [Streptococcus thermophilus]